MSPRVHVPETGWVPVQANGLTHAVFVDGEEDAPLVVLQHGFPDTPHTWDDVLPYLLDAGYRVARPWGRGIAPSEIPASDAYDVEDTARDLVGIIEALGAESAILVGHDWGAWASWGAVYVDPSRIQRLVAVAIPHPVSIVPRMSVVWGARHLITNRMPWATRRFCRNDFAEIRTMYERWSPGFNWPDAEFEPAKNAYAAPGSAHGALGYYRALRPWPFRGRVSVPTDVIGGLSDGVATPEDFERSRRFIKAPCEVHMLPGGHFLHREHPDPFRETLMEILGPAR